MSETRRNRTTEIIAPKILGLSRAEYKIIAALVRIGEGDVSGIAFESGVPRTTTYAALRRLKERGIVRQLAGGAKTQWRLSRRGKLKRLHRQSLQFFDSAPGTLLFARHETLGEVSSVQIGIRVYRGARALEKAYSSMLELSKGERVFAIQGNPSAKASLTVPREWIEKLHTKLKKRHIIMHAVMGRSVLDLFGTMDLQYLWSHYGRLVIASLLPNAYMDFPLDVLVMRERVLFISLEKEIVITISYPPLVAFFRGFILLAEHTGERVDLNSLVSGLAEKKATTME